MMNISHIFAKSAQPVIFSMIMVFSANLAEGAALTAAEVNQIETDLNITLSSNDIAQLSAIVLPANMPSWRTDAYDRIDTHRKADLDIQVEDMNGDPVEGAQVAVKLKDHDFRFSGVLRVKDLTDAENNLQGISTNRYQEVFQKLYNGVGLNNGLKQKLRNGFESYLPNFFNWAQSINMPVRGHLLIWPGGTHMTPAVRSKVEALETLWNDVYHSKSYRNVATNDTVATVDALSGDTVVVLVSSNVGSEPLETNVTFSGSASISPSLFDRVKGTGPSVGYWYSDVTADGTVRVDLSKGTVYQSVVVYHLRPDGGAINLLDTDSSSQSAVSGVTNSYGFAGTSSGIVLEGVSTYATSTEPLSSAWMLVNAKRKAAHSYFSNVSSLESVWTNADEGNTASYGLAFANARVVGEQEAKLAEPALQQQLKDQIQADISEWASLWPVYEWDVINETRANHRIQDLIGWDQMAEWFKIGASNSVLPECQYLLNEYGVISASPVAIKPTEYTSNRDIMMSHLDIIQTNGAPLNRIGFQSRITRGYLDPDVVYDRLDDFGTRYGLEMVATEFEVRENAGNSFFPDETDRAQITEEMLTTYFSHPLVSGFTAWTYMSTETWAMCEYDGTIKLNGLVWYYLHRIRYMTDTNETTDVTGTASVRGFKGDYDITVTYEGTDYPATLTLTSNQTAVVVLSDVTQGSGTSNRLIEVWQMNDAPGTQLSGLSNAVGSAQWGGDVPNAAAANGNLRFTQGSSASDNLYRNAGLTKTNITTGVYELEFNFAAAFMDGGDKTGANVGFGIRDASAGNDLFLIRLQHDNHEIHLQTRINDSNVTLYDFHSETLPDPVTVRAVFDLESDRMDLYYRIGGGAETVIENIAIVDGAMDAMRMVAALNTTDFGAADFVDVDYITLRDLNWISAEGLYGEWVAGYPVTGSSTNLTDNPDGDVADNLLEYAFGGDPMNGLDTGYWPISQTLEAGGTNYLEHVHVQRNDADARGLEYRVETTDDLMSGVWTNAGFLFMGEGAMNGEFDAVTNWLPVVDGAGFLRIKTTYTP